MNHLNKYYDISSLPLDRLSEHLDFLTQTENNPYIKTYNDRLMDIYSMKRLWLNRADVAIDDSICVRFSMSDMDTI